MSRDLHSQHNHIGLIIYVSDFTSEVNNLRPPSTDDCNPPSGHQVRRNAMGWDGSRGGSRVLVPHGSALRTTLLALRWVCV